VDKKRIKDAVTIVFNTGSKYALFFPLSFPFPEVNDWIPVCFQMMPQHFIALDIYPSDLKASGNPGRYTDPEWQS
jgi:hypothetical protein